MIENKPLRRIVLTADAEKYSSRTRDGQEAVQHGLMSVLDAAGHHSDLRRPDWNRQPQGDAEVAVLPPGTVEGEAVSGLIGGLATALHHHNRSLNDAYRLRLRVAIDQGNVAMGDAGFVGNAVVSACRMRDSDLLRGILTDHPRADFVVAVSDSIYTDVIAHGDHELYRWRFAPHDVRVKEWRARVWVCVPEPSPSTSEHGSGAAEEPDGSDGPASAPREPGAAQISYGHIDAQESKGANFGVVRGDLKQDYR